MDPARHSHIKRTMNRSCHMQLSDEAAALDALPQFPSVFTATTTETAALCATGTDDATAACENVLPSYLPAHAAKPLISVHHSTLSDDARTTSTAETKTPQNPDERRDSAAESGESGIRTRGSRDTRYADLANRCIRPLCHLSE